MPFHRINLRGPWDYQWLDGHGVPSSTQGTIAMPCEWRLIFGAAAGTARFRRKFHKPTNLESHEVVKIVLTEIRGSGTVSLNGDHLADFSSSGEAVEIEITPFLNPFNELSIDLKFDPIVNSAVQGGLFGVTAIEIRSGESI